MKALSIRQPWAHLILTGGKNIENRKWNTRFRGRFLIHAAKRPDSAAFADFCFGGGNSDDLIYGAVFASAELVDVVTESDSPWFQGPFGFVLKDVRPEPIRWVKGKLGFFEVAP